MPLKRNNNKQKHKARKKAVTMRLMAISLLVDKYVYKNKKITISQAHVYLEELMTFKSQCLGDAPSLQVCEKLTRCMRGIIDEQQSIDAVLEDADTFIEQNHSSKRYAASPVYSLPDDDKAHMASELIPDLQSETNKSYYNYRNNNSDTHVEDKENNDGLRKSVRFCIDDKTNNVDLTTSINFNSENLYNVHTNQQCNVDNELTNVIVDLTLKDIEQPISIDVDMCSQSILKNLEANETSQTLDEHCMNDTCGQDMLEFDREIRKLIEHEDQSCVEYIKDSITQISTPETLPETMKKIPDVPKTSVNAEIRTELFGNLETKKVLKSKTTQNSKIIKKKICKKKSTDNTPKTKRKNKNTDFKITKNDANTEILTPVTNNSELLKTSKNSGNATNGGSNIRQNANKIKIVNNQNTVQQHSGSNCSSNIVQEAAPNISKMDVSNFACHREDLSWVENITYVREIHPEEYNFPLKPYSESFWDNCELPDNWDSRDFE